MDRNKGNQWGSDIIRTRISREPYFLEQRTWRDFKFWEWIFIIFALLSIGISIGFSCFQLVLAISNKDKYIFPVLIILNNSGGSVLNEINENEWRIIRFCDNTLILLSNLVFSAYFLWNGVIEELPFKLLMQLVIKTIIWIFDLIYFLMQSKEVGEAESPDNDTRREIRDIRFYISSAMLFMTITSGGFVIYQYWTSNIAIFRTVGTDPKYVRLCRLRNLCQSLMLLDAVVFITVLFHLCNFPEFLDTYASYYLLPVWLIVTAAYVLLGIKATEKESRKWTYIFYVASHFQPIFVIYMLVKATRSSLGLLLYISLYVTAGLSFLAHIGLLIVVVRLQLSYGMGLKQAAAREVERKTLVTTLDSHGRGDGDMESKQFMSTHTQPPTETEL